MQQTHSKKQQRNINEQLTKTKTKKGSYNNLTKKKLGALGQLKRCDDIIITSTDKGRAIIIQDVKLYIKEAEGQLNNTENYRPQPNDPTRKIVAERLITQMPRTPRSYTKSKTHKEGIPGRPVISSVNCQLIVQFKNIGIC